MRRIQALVLLVVACCAAACSHGCGGTQQQKADRAAEWQAIGNCAAQAAASVAQKLEDAKLSGQKVNAGTVIIQLAPEELACLKSALGVKAPPVGSGSGG